MQFTIKNVLAMRKLGGVIARSSMSGTIFYLQGPLGTGKTTFVHGFIKKIGYQGQVKSPTFNLLEIYQVDKQIICHFDLYRLKQPEELVYIGVTDYFNKKNVCLIEWPENGGRFLPAQDLLCCFDFAKKSSVRVVQMIPNSPLGENILKQVN
ncbi:MAG: tRNA (adenosine(37)-N6)-threonylcarbamoyltransferase complex ATPase subunit type 1 TsaE [Coxiellaceae bacterium]|jgi:tRNA threonylcarbamoyladenosine biosynthesis protein TsaE|nr:tRNA (adenosine(37)-N6)-threonylcarbamoyltransferase complex ATPase subunit type 1 TsaE [Coxiellaceae bacterium]